MNSELNRDVVLGYLVSLGDTAEEVAKTLREIGITGWRLNSRSCPIAQYLYRCGFSHPWVTRNRVMDHDVDVCRAIDLPNAVKWFIDAYDKGKIPLLKETEHE